MESRKFYYFGELGLTKFAPNLRSILALSYYRILPYLRRIRRPVKDRLHWRGS